MKIPKSAEFIINVLNNHSYEAYVVGGCVRDCIMGRTPLDFDITTSAQPEMVRALFSKTVDTGIEHGTITVLIDGESFEVTTYRIDGEYNDCRRPDTVEFTKNLKDDLERRDFTINAVAYHKDIGFVDPFFGIPDIDKKLIRGVGNPDKRFKEDALRMMRCVRFSVQLGFDIEEETYKALVDNVGLIKKISMERVREELVKALLGDYLENIFLFEKTGLLENIGFVECDYRLLSNVEKNIIHRLAVVLKGCENAKELLLRFKFSNKEIKAVMVVLEYLSVDIGNDLYEVKKIISVVGLERFLDIIEVKSALGEDMAEVKEMYAQILIERPPLGLKDLKVDGKMLIKEKICEHGRDVGRVLAFLLDAVLREPRVNTREELLRLAASC